ncbi:hypothetical protein HHK36_031038 [Tetracentron sinense]|uniref:MYB transcription factor n=1 Tax=Tetracentron sinense TaxID=13715 RepID=A0A834YAV2_TETSI|nr:hypothetical protein HHK36_031038 [Tetracentron sinense]
METRSFALIMSSPRSVVSTMELLYFNSDPYPDEMEGGTTFSCSDSCKKVFGLLLMGAPKQKWTSEEEAALKAGVVKHGAGKWRTILKDPEFSGVLHLRSNVDLKSLISLDVFLGNCTDKWRNLSVTANGWGSREKARLSFKRSHQFPKHDDNSMALSTIVQSDEGIVDAKPLAISRGTSHIAGPKRSILRLDNLIFEAISNLKEPNGSNRAAIAIYIEKQYLTPPNFKRLLSAKLKFLAANGRLIKVKRKYRIAVNSAVAEGRSSSLLLLEGKQRDSPRVDKDDIKILNKSQIDAELAKMRNMTVQEAAAAAARAVAEAEVAMAEAEEAAREAEAAEANAEAAQAFAEAAAMMLKGRNTSKLIVNA